MKHSNESILTIYCCMYADCPSSYSTKFNLQRHVESVHLNVKRYQCQLCQALCSSRQNLREHLYIHKGLMPFICRTCDMSFRQASQLSIHRRVHLAEGVVPRSEKIKLDEESWGIKAIEVNLEVNKGKLALPKIQERPRELQKLPFPFVF